MVDLQLKLNMKLISEQLKQQQEEVKHQSIKLKHKKTAAAVRIEKIKEPRYNLEVVPGWLVNFDDFFQDSVPVPTQNLNAKRTQTIKHFDVPVDKIPWSVDFPEYAPIMYTSEPLDNEDNQPRNLEWYFWYRPSYHGLYQLTVDNFPLNVAGRTGILGRGELKEWGPNYTNCQIITKLWMRDAAGEKVVDATSQKPKLAFMTTKINFGCLPALPGENCEKNQWLSDAIAIEFDSNRNRFPLKRKNINLVYKGYVEHVHNTDNAWYETIVFNVHDEEGVFCISMQNMFGWTELDQNVRLRDDQHLYLELVARHHDAHW